MTEITEKDTLITPKINGDSYDSNEQLEKAAQLAAAQDLKAVVIDLLAYIAILQKGIKSTTMPPVIQRAHTALLKYGNIDLCNTK